MIFAASALCAQANDPCQAAVLNPELSCSPGERPGNIEGDIKVALACEWIDPSRVGHVLNALELLTSSSQAPEVNRKVLHELRTGDPNDENLYLAAIGNPGAYGQSRPNFPDLLAKANRLSQEEGTVDDRKASLFSCTQDRINDIFDAHCDSPTVQSCDKGPIALVKIHTSFSQKNNYVALYQLLIAAWEQSSDADLEKLRAAFAMDTDRLAKQVAAKIAAPKN